MNCLSEGREVFAVMPTEYMVIVYLHFNCLQLQHLMIKKVACLLTNSGSGKEGKVTWLRLCLDLGWQRFIQHSEQHMCAIFAY